MTRISDTQVARNLLVNIQSSRTKVDKYGNEISSGVKVSEPGDSNVSGTIAQFNESLAKIKGYSQRASDVKGFLTLQDDVMATMNDLLTRAKEIATQAANETNGSDARAQMASEIYEIRDHVASLANTTYKGRYIFGAADDDDPPYDLNATFFANPATGREAGSYVFDAETGTSTVRTINITDDVQITLGKPANQLFGNALEGLERLGRSLAGYATNPPIGTAPDGTGAAYVFPTDYHQQTLDIQGTIDQLDDARVSDIIPERTSLGGKLRRIETAESLLELGKVNAEDALGRLQNADVVESASNLQLAQTALNASLTVSTRLLGQSILDFL